jgi:DNA-binding XRE family transcriptional regulator
MEDALFAELLASADEAVAIARGESSVGRMTTYVGAVLFEIRDGEEEEWSLLDAAVALQQEGDRGDPVSGGPVSNLLDVRHLRKKLRQSPEGMAQILGVSADTVRQWERGTRQPNGPSRTLLRIASRNPKALLEAHPELTPSN